MWGEDVWGESVGVWGKCMCWDEGKDCRCDPCLLQRMLRK